ncbi:unnamed protein product [Toxocara canis]|uniref:Secreted protein n=1 Tax=Toxocara canis TaxID=6265 RepID=A0A183USM4_TOXCA|nr:unnamed protein product [Toxocara canis]
MRLLVLVAMLTDVASSLKCFSCASADYEPLFEKSAALRHSLSSPRFGDLCDSVEQLLAVAPVETCPSTCISLLEPQYFGDTSQLPSDSGVQSYSTPYTYIRGCASTVFASIKERPREIDFLHTEAICLPLRLSQIWPSIHTDEHVQVWYSKPEFIRK